MRLAYEQGYQAWRRLRQVRDWVFRPSRGAGNLLAGVLGMLVCCLGHSASANVGSTMLGYSHQIKGWVFLEPQMWIWPIAFGVLEGGALAWMRRSSLLMCVGFLILANLASTLVGGEALVWLGDGLARAILPIELLPVFLCCAAIACFLASILVEWPFVHAALRRRWLSTLGFSSVAQCVSFPVLILAVWSSGSISLATDVGYDPSLLSSVPNEGWVYYISAGREKLMRTSLDGSASEEVMPLDLDDREAFLAALPSEVSDRWDLWVCDMDRWSCSRRLVSPLPRGLVSVRPASRDGRSFLDPRLAALVQGQEKHSRNVTVGLTGAEGMRCRVHGRDSFIALSFHTPLSAPTFKHPLVLHGGMVIVQWSGQILLVDCRERRVARLAYGSGPVAVLVRSENSQGAPVPPQNRIRTGELAE